MLLAVVLLKYYRIKQYRAVFRAALGATLAMVLYYVFVYISIMAWVSRAQTAHMFIITVFVTFIAVLIYAATLVFSDAGRRPWLKAAGIFMIIYYGIMLATLVIPMTSSEPSVNASSQKLQQWTVWLEGVWPLFFIVNFVTERGTRRSADTSVPHPSWSASVIALGAAAVVGAFIVAPKLTVEKDGMARWLNRPRELSKQYAEPFEPRTYVNDQGKSIQFRFIRPLDYDSTQRYPLVVCLHGGAGTGTGNFEQIEGSWGALMLMGDNNRKKFPAFIFVPQCPPHQAWGGIPSLPAVDSLTFEAIAEFEKEFPIDVTRRYIIGESLGGYGTWHFISTRPEMFAAAIPICGEGDPALAGRVAQVEVWAFHGEKDRSVPVSGSRNMIEAMRKAGADPRYSEFEGAGHIIKDQITRTPGVFEWLFAQRKVE